MAVLHLRESKITASDVIGEGAAEPVLGAIRDRLQERGLMLIARQTASTQSLSSSIVIPATARRRSIDVRGVILEDHDHEHALLTCEKTDGRWLHPTGPIPTTDQLQPVTRQNLAGGQC